MLLISYNNERIITHEVELPAFKLALLNAIIDDKISILTHMQVLNCSSIKNTRILFDYSFEPTKIIRHSNEAKRFDNQSVLQLRCEDAATSLFQ